MAKAVFEWREDRELGGEGWILKGCPDFNASMGLGLAHDTMEHFADGDGEMGAEMEAFGAMMLIRGESGWFEQRRGGRSVVENMSSDIANFLQSVRQGRSHLKNPGKTYRLSEEIEQNFQAALEKGVQIANDEDYDNCEPTYTGDRNVDWMLGWMRKGYRRAVRRYAGNDSHELAYAFNQVIEAYEKHKDGYTGDELHVRVHNKTLKVTTRQIRTYD